MIGLDLGLEDHDVALAGLQQHDVPQGDLVAVGVVQRPEGILLEGCASGDSELQDSGRESVDKPLSQA